MAEKKEEKVDNTYLKQFGQRLQTLKKESGLTYRKIATRCNIDFADIKKYENGETDVRLTTIGELAKGYDKHPKKLLEFDWGDDYPSDEEDGLQERISQLEAHIERMEAEYNVRAIAYVKTIDDLTKQLAEKEEEIKQLKK